MASEPHGRRPAIGYTTASGLYGASHRDNSMIRFIYQYNGDPTTREYETVAVGTQPPNVGIYIWRKIGSQNLEWVVDNVTTTRETIAATPNSPEQYQTDYIIDLGAAPAA